MCQIDSSAFKFMLQMRLFLDFFNKVNFALIYMYQMG